MSSIARDQEIERIAGQDAITDSNGSNIVSGSRNGHDSSGTYNINSIGCIADNALVKATHFRQLDPLWATEPQEFGLQETAREDSFCRSSSLEVINYLSTLSSQTISRAKPFAIKRLLARAGIVGDNDVKMNYSKIVSVLKTRK